MSPQEVQSRVALLLTVPRSSVKVVANTSDLSYGSEYEITVTTTQPDLLGRENGQPWS